MFLEYSEEDGVYSIAAVYATDPEAVDSVSVGRFGKTPPKTGGIIVVTWQWWLTGKWFAGQGRTCPRHARVSMHKRSARSWRWRHEHGLTLTDRIKVAPRGLRDVTCAISASGDFRTTWRFRFLSTKTISFEFSYRQKNISALAAKLWNKLPFDVTASLSLTVFRRSLNLFYFVTRSLKFPDFKLPGSICIKFIFMLYVLCLLYNILQCMLHQCQWALWSALTFYSACYINVSERCDLPWHFIVDTHRFYSILCVFIEVCFGPLNKYSIVSFHYVAAL